MNDTDLFRILFPDISDFNNSECSLYRALSTSHFLFIYYFFFL